MKLATLPVAVVFSVSALAAVAYFGMGGSGRLERADFPPVEVVDNAPKISETGPYPKAVVGEDMHEFGSMEVGTKRSHDFKIFNEGDAPLVLAKGRTTCKCTLSEMENGEVAPGRSVVVTIEWEPLSTDEMFSQEAEILTNDPENPSIRFAIRGKVHKMLQFYPPEGILLGDVNEDRPTESEVRLYSSVSGDFEITAIKGSIPQLTAEAHLISDGSIQEHGAKKGYLLKVSLAPGIPIGPFRGTLDVETDARDGESIEILVEGNRTGPLKLLARNGAIWSARSRTLTLGRFKSDTGRKVTCDVFVSSGAEINFELSDLEVKPAFIQVEFHQDNKFKSAGRQRFELIVDVPAGSPTTVHSAANPAVIRAKTNHPDMPELVINVLFVCL